MNSRKVREAMQTVFERLRALDSAELRRQIDAHRDGPLSKQLIESGMFEARVAEGRELLSIANGPDAELPTYLNYAFVTHVGYWFLSNSSLLEMSATLAASTPLVYSADMEIQSTALWQAFWSNLPIWDDAALATTWLTADQKRTTLSWIEEASSIEQLAWAA